MEEHYAKLKRNQFKSKAVLEREFLEKFPKKKDFLEKLYVQQKLDPVFHLRPILELATIYPKETMLKAFALAREYSTFSCHFIRGLIDKEAPQEVAPEPSANSLWAVPAITVRANLSAYQKPVTRLRLSAAGEIQAAN